jgi:two-component system response regulator YesN
MIYRILLVDDEPSVTDWLTFLIGDTFGGEADVYRFNEPAPAMRYMRDNAFDIAILDINMPVTDGMEMLDFICRTRPDARVIFLTGFDQFEYAKKAVNRQVVAYILKNEEDEVLLGAIRSAMRQIDEECGRQRLMELARRRLDAAGPALRREYLVRLLQRPGGEKPDFPVRLNIDGSSPFCLLWCLAGGSAGAPADVGTVFAAGLAAEAELEKHFVFESLMPDEAGWLWLLQPSDGAPWAPASFGILKLAMEAAQLRFSRQTGGNLCFMHSSRPILLENLAEAYMSLRPLRALTPAGAHAVLTDEDLADVPGAGSGEAPPAGYESAAQSAPLLQRLLDQGEREEFFEVLARMSAPMNRQDRAADPWAEEAFMAVSSTFLSYINRLKLADKLPRALPLRMLYDAGLHGSWENAASFFREVTAVLFAQQDDRRESRASIYVQKARRYISEHLDEDLSLISLADKVMLNPSYFSTLFKGATGINLSDYIKSERIRKAKELLEDKKYRINEISRMVGYGNPAYFTRFFKNETGLAPIEYRNKTVENHNK